MSWKRSSALQKLLAMCNVPNSRAQLLHFSPHHPSQCISVPSLRLTGKWKCLTTPFSSRREPLSVFPYATGTTATTQKEKRYPGKKNFAFSKRHRAVPSQASTGLPKLA